MVDSKSQYDRYNCEELFDKVVFNEYKKLRDVAQKVRANQCKYEDYMDQIRKLHSTVTSDIAMHHQIPFEKYRKIEDQLFGQFQLRPTINSEVICIVSYSSPAGRNHYSRCSSHSIFEVDHRYQELQKIVAQKDSEQERKKRERAKMSDSLRYDILHRDGFRCQICGRSSKKDGVKLQVDHIVPIAKGGKTEKNNLRTLCDQCNRGKSDKIE